MKKLISGNWKMYKNAEEVKSFLAAVAAKADSLDGAELLIFAQAPFLPLIEAEWKKMGGHKFLNWGPQNIHWEEKGAFTGELAPTLARSFGCAYALAGHSERRQFFGETNETAAKRATAAHKYGMKSVFCLGEQLAERDAGKTFDVVREQAKALFALSKEGPQGLAFAYEPVWAIGTGRTATSAQAQEVHAFLRQEIASAWGQDYAAKCRILYGGSVKPENSAELMGQKDVDGVLVGGASLEPASFLAIAAAGKG